MLGGAQLKTSKKTVIIFLALALVFLAGTVKVLAAISTEYQDRLEMLKEKLRTNGVSDGEFERILADRRVEIYPNIVNRSGKGFNYMSKRFGLLTRDSIQRGKKILAENADELRKMESTYGVSKEIVIAILRIETDFGKNTGSYPVFNSLLTFSLIENRRSRWAENELVSLLQMCRDQGKDPLTIKGSWAGAFGYAQFLPSSYIKFAVDGNGDGIIDLYTFSDAFASIANYLKLAGWEQDKTKKKRKAVYAYNHCTSYVKAVFAYAKAIRKN